MATLGQGDNWVGHHTTLAGYDDTTDRFLLLDVWPKTESCWAATEDIYTAMNTLDEDSNLYRGYCIICF